ncbi:MAG: IclR family transcriptional regulator C-terminal domain-containing protein [Actinocatenispora sp.]
MSRALRILEAVGRSQRGLTVKQIARRCGLGLSTTYHLVRTLAYEGYLLRCSDGTYLPGLEVADRFREFTAAMRPPDDTASGLRRAVRATGYSHFLAQFVNGHVAITDVVEGSRSPHLEDLVVGFDEAAHATAIGKALLSTLEPGRRQSYLSMVGMRPYTRATIVDREQLEHDLAGLRRRGTYVEMGQFRENVACAAAVIPPRTTEDSPMVLACSMSLEEFQRSENTVLTQLSGVARSLAAAVANSPTPPSLPV